MKKNIIIFGNTEYAYMIANYIKEFNDHKILAFTVDEKYITSQFFHNIPVIPFENIEKHFSLDNVEFVIGIGYKAMNSVRESIYKRIKEKNYLVGGFIHPTAVVETTEIGEGNIILSDAYIGKNANIGNANIFWNKSNISHDATIGDYNYFAPSVTFGGFVNVQNNCFFGLGCIVKNGLTISDSSLIGAGTYLDRNTEPFDVFVPERSVKLKYKSTNMNI